MNSEKIAKEIIVIRTDIKMTIGKVIAQGGHAIMAPLLDLIRDQNNGEIPRKFSFEHNNDALDAWFNGRFRKIILSVKTEIELLDLYEKLKSHGIRCSLIQDAGFTEFNNIPTYTAIGIIPMWEEEIDPFTKHLKLYRNKHNDD